MFKVIGTETYLKRIEKLDFSEQKIAQKIPEQLSQNPFSGKSLCLKFLREKK